MKCCYYTNCQHMLVYADSCCLLYYTNNGSGFPSANTLCLFGTIQTLCKVRVNVEARFHSLPSTVCWTSEQVMAVPTLFSSLESEDSNSSDDNKSPNSLTITKVVRTTNKVLDRRVSNFWEIWEFVFDFSLPTSILKLSFISVRIPQTDID